MQILLAYLPRHLSTVEYYHHHSEGCSYRYTPLLKERVKRSERNHVSLHQIKVGNLIYLIFKLTRGRETCAG